MYKKLIHILTTHIFIIATSIAAVVHSTVVLDIAFNGPETDFASHPGDAIWRKFVAFLIALSLDIGQVVTSSELKNGQRSKPKLATFFVLAASTYLLQFSYLVGHIPETVLAPGVNPLWASTVKLIVQCGVFLIPALLPGSTILYTFSQTTPDAEIFLEKEKARLQYEFEEAKRRADLDHQRVQSELQEQMNKLRLEAQELQQKVVDAPAKVKQLTSGTENFLPLDDGKIRVTCPDCNFSRDYLDVGKATSGIRSHTVYCKKTKVAIDANIVE